MSLLRSCSLVIVALVISSCTGGSTGTDGGLGTLPISLALSSVESSGLKTTADGTSALTVKITLKDEGGKPVPGVAVAIAVSGTANTLDISGSATDADGVLQGSLRSTKAEEKTVSATVTTPDGTKELSGKVVVTFEPGPVDLVASTFVAEPSTAVADGVAVMNLKAKLVDAQGNAITAMPASVVSTGTLNTITQALTATDASGEVTATIASTKAETKTLSLMAGASGTEQKLSTEIAAVFTPGALDIAVSTVTVSPSSVVANGTATSTVTVKATDAQGNPLAGLAVALSATGLQNTLVQPAVTNASGETTGTIASTRAEAKTISATVTSNAVDVVLTTKPVVTFNPGPLDAALSTVARTPATVVANGTTSSLFTITTVDAQGNPIPGLTVVLSSTGTQNTFGQPAVTDATGVTTGTIASTKAESKTVTATVTTSGGDVPLTTTQTVTFSPGPVDLTLSTATVLAGSVVANDIATKTISVHLIDAHGNPLAGLPVLLTSSGTDNSISSAAATNASGDTSATIKSTRAEVKTITTRVTTNSGWVFLTQQPTVTFVAGPYDSTSSSLSTSTYTVVANGTATATYTTTVRDAWGNPISGATVLLSSTGSSNTFVQPSVTNALGVATGTLASTVAEEKSIHSYVTPLSGSPAFVPGTLYVDYVSGPVSLSLSTVGASPSTLDADGTSFSTISIHTVDANNNPVKDVVSILASTGSSNNITHPIPTDTSGNATGKIKSTVAEQKTLEVTVQLVSGDAILTTKPVVTFQTAPVNASQSDVYVNGTTFPTNTATTCPVHIYLKDLGGNPVVGVSAQIAVSGTDNVIVQPVGVSDSIGYLTGSVRATTPGQRTVTVTANPGPNAVVLVTEPVITWVVGAPSSITSTVVGPGSTVVADGTAGGLVTTTVRDQANNPIPNLTVTLDATGTSNTWSTSATGQTDSSGQFSATLSSTVAENKYLYVYAGTGTGGTIIASNLTPVQLVPGSPNVTATTWAATSPTMTAAGSNYGTLTVKDANGNPISGLAVTFDASEGTIDPSDTTDSSGTIVVYYTSNVSGTKTLNANLSAFTKSLNVTVNPDIPSNGTTTIAMSPSSVLADGIATTTVTLTVRDSHSNVIGSQDVTITSSGSNNTLSGTGTTNASGQFSTTLKSTKAEVKTVTGSTDDGNATANDTVTFTPGPATHLAFVAQPSDVVAMAQADIDVDVLDQYENKVSSTYDVSLGLTGGNSLSFVTGTTWMESFEGQAAFSVQITAPASGVQYMVTAPGLSTILSDPFDVTAGAWQSSSNGLNGGAIFDLAVNPATPSEFYALTYKGPFRSIDSGATWIPINAGQMFDSLFIRVNSDGSAIYHGGYPGLYNSENGGKTWRKLTAAPSQVMAVAMHPTSASTFLVAGTSAPLVYKTTDSGKTFAPATGLSGSASFGALAYSLSNPLIAYYCDGTVVYKSIDGGASWTATATNPSGTVKKLIVHPTLPGTVYLALESNGVEVTTDSGAIWTNVSSGITNLSMYSLAMDPDDSQILYAGASSGGFKTINGGTSWTPHYIGTINNAMLVDPGDSTHVLMGASNMMWNSTDSGANWSQGGVGIHMPTVRSSTIHPTNPDIRYAIAQNFVFKTTDGAATWAQSSTGLNTAFTFHRLVVDNTTPATLYVAGTLGVWKSTDSGGNWTMASGGLAGFPQLTGLHINPANTLQLYTRSSNELSISTNGAGSWTPVVTGLPQLMYNFAVDPSDFTHVFATVSDGSSGYNLWESTASGASMVLVAAMPNAANALAVHPTNPLILWATGNDGTYKSINGGDTWTQMHASNGASLVIDPATPATVYVSTYSSTDGVLKTTDSGATWAQLKSGLQGSAGYDLSISPSSPAKLMLGTDLGVAVTSSGGE